MFIDARFANILSPSGEPHTLLLLSEARITRRTRREEDSEELDGFWDAQGVAPLGLRTCGIPSCYKHAAPLGLRFLYI